MDSSSTLSSNREFFKVFLPNSSSQHMNIPPAFMKFFNGSVPSKAVLRDHVGKFWHVTLEELTNCVCFKNGWQEFANDHFLKYGDFLIFQYDGSHIFDVKIFGKNGCKKELVSAVSSFFPIVKIKGEPHSDEDSKLLIRCKRKHSEVRSSGSSDTVHKSRRISTTDLAKPSASETADHVSTKTPVFEHIIRPWSNNVLYIPTPVLVSNNVILESSDMVLIDEKGRSWPVIVKSISRHRSAITTGWSIFFREKNLRVDDKCTFEFVLGRRNICQAINVKITPAMHELDRRNR